MKAIDQNFYKQLVALLRDIEAEDFDIINEKTGEAEQSCHFEDVCGFCGTVRVRFIVKVETTELKCRFFTDKSYDYSIDHITDLILDEVYDTDDAKLDENLVEWGKVSEGALKAMFFGIDKEFYKILQGEIEEMEPSDWQSVYDPQSEDQEFEWDDVNGYYVKGGVTLNVITRDDSFDHEFGIEYIYTLIVDGFYGIYIDELYATDDDYATCNLASLISEEQLKKIEQQ